MRTPVPGWGPPDQKPPGLSSLEINKISLFNAINWSNLTTFSDPFYRGGRARCVASACFVTDTLQLHAITSTRPWSLLFFQPLPTLLRPVDASKNGFNNRIIRELEEESVRRGYNFSSFSPLVILTVETSEVINQKERKMKRKWTISILAQFADNC
ncbi:hypothetical protein J6590_005223 [Homalodisca vitripennis]|nr:hypothetical protein J6590_005223 [Homalodisca vitripennis]